MKNLTTPKAILMSSILIASAVIFRIDDSSVLVSGARAEVAGMGYADLRRDRDFKKAVAYVVESYTVEGYVDGDYLYSTSISC